VKKYKFNMDASDETKLEWKEWKEGRDGTAFHKNYYEHAISSHHSESSRMGSSGKSKWKRF
jgi:hypothetical protein